MGFTQRRPVAPLDALIEKIWDWDMPAAAHHFERVLPQPGAQLIINLCEDETRVYTDEPQRQCLRSSGSVLGGPRLTRQIIDTAEQVRVMGVVFLPGGAHALTAENQQALLARDINLEDLFGAAARQLRQRLLDTAAPGMRLQILEQWLCAQQRGPSIDPAVLHVTAALDHAPQWACIASLVKQTGVSDDTLRMRFRRQIGMGPKRYARLQRFRAVLVQVHQAGNVDWCRVASDGGFTDQAHLVREFRAFSGLTPGEFMARRGAHLNHLMMG